MLLAKEVGVDPTDVNYVAYDGGGELLAGILGGDVAFARDRRRRVRRVGRGRRGPDPRRHQRGAPSTGVDAPTLTEEGVDLVFANWRGIVAPPGLSDADTQKWVDAITEMHDSEAWKKALEDQGWTDAFLTGDEFGDFLTEESERVESRHELSWAWHEPAAPGARPGSRAAPSSEWPCSSARSASSSSFDAPRCRTAGSPGRPGRPGGRARSWSAACWSSCAVFLAVDVLRGGRGEPRAARTSSSPRRSDWRTVLHAGGGVPRQRPADRAARLAHLRRDPVLGLGLRARQPALRPRRRHRARAVVRHLVPVRRRPRHLPARSAS